ncbi:TlpA family protein disulfide reductase [Altericroceibacterium endophyticum]|uniref:Redoxin family protein n=1 Tax=Altericroceibacterium endophyticum TaxID=1808508 RepID=A0A6I4TAN9_9SPHN|nr:TlpA disulfide reductase family protein [Altericroceibacterium endophyticum]MXO66930.1 redoxin family protein [Altericroceibacterium endophyticum]
MARSLTLLSTLLLALLTAACDRESTEEAQQQENSAGEKADELTGEVDRSHVGAPLPAVTVADPAGVTANISEMTGKPLLLNLWATWCVPCVTEMPLLNELAGELGDDVRVMVVSEDMGGAEQVEAFFAETPLPNLHPWMDPENDLPFGYGGGELPMTVMYDAGGHEVWRITGGFDWAGAEARALVDEARAAAPE